MKIPLLLILFIAIASTGIAQTGIVKGRVIDARTFKPLAFATVYLNQTTKGTVTNLDGDFIIQNIRPGDYDLIVSYIGYQHYQSHISVNDVTPLAMSIKMSPSTTNLAEVVVNAKKDNQWSARYDKFHKEFFGNSQYTSDCTIRNPWVLDFIEDEKGLFTATAALPIEIENLGLGYNITCQLKEFVVGPKIYKISGTYRFEEAATNDTTLSTLWHLRRQQVYMGSPRHLLRSITQNRVTEEGFDLYTDISNNPEVIRNSSFLTNLNVSLKPLLPTSLSAPGPKTGQYIIMLPHRTEVHYLNRSAPAKIYRNVPHPISWLEVPNGPIDVTADGILINPNRLTALGAMSEARVAELLPIDFQPSPSLSTGKDVTAVNGNPYSKLTALLEKPYLMTDKPYYYPSDAILFKAFFNYISPAYRDSLSHIMHVELIDASSKIIQSKMFPLFAGTSYGDITLPVTVTPGDYTLRAYTRWMLNFDEKLIFTKAIKVLPLHQLAKAREVTTTSKQLQIRTEKDEFTTREKITVTIDPTNFYGNPIAADIAISVTDLEQAATPLDEKTILNSFQFSGNMLPDTTLTEAKYLIQQGIDFKGQLVAGKNNEPSSGVLTVYQENVTDVFGVATDNSGLFHQQLQLTDSAELLIAAKTLKGRAGRVIMDQTREPVPAVIPAAPLQLEVYKPSDSSKYHVIDLYSTAKMLDEVTIEAKRIEHVSADNKYLMSDSHLEGAFLRSTNATDLLSALRGRVPGLMILYMRDPATGDVARFLTFSNGMSSWFSVQEPLVEVDGVVLSSIEGISIADRLATMTVREVESVDVMRFASASAYGARAASGVIVIKTNRGDKPTATTRKLDRTKLQPVRMLGYSIPKKFRSPDYSEHAAGDDRADYRSTIYWNPLLASDGKEPVMVSFYAADVPTSYRIVVEGVTAEGQAIRGEKIIVVRSKK